MSIPSYLQKSPVQTEENQFSDEKSVIENNGFFPSIELHDFNTRYQVNSSYSIERKLNLLQIAIQHTNNELLDRVCYWNQCGYYNLADVPAQQLGECSELMMTYRQAVYAKAMGLLIDRYRSTDSSRYGLMKADAKGLEHVSEEYELEFRQAIYSLIGRRGQSVFAELI
jgi:hypothetical protein